MAFVFIFNFFDPKTVCKSASQVSGVKQQSNLEKHKKKTSACHKTASL